MLLVAEIRSHLSPEESIGRFLISSSPRRTLLGAASLCNACPPSGSPNIAFKADVIDTRSCIVKNHRSRADGAL